MRAMSTSPSNTQPEAIAIVGLGALYPGSDSPQAFWNDIVQARDRITDVPPTHWLIDDYYDADPRAPDKTYAKRGGFLPAVEFDPMEFGIPPNILPATDTSQLLAVMIAKSVLEDVERGLAGRPLKIDRERTSVILGVCGAAESVGPLVSRLQRPIWAKALREGGMAEAEIDAACERIASHFVPWQENSFPGSLANVVAGRVANRLDLHGSNLTTDAACASSLAAVHAGVNQLLLGEADLVISGGVDTNNDIFAFMCFSKTPAMSPTGDSRPFAANADGMMKGEGLGMLALKRLSDAERDGNRIYAVLRGIGSASDGRSKSIYAPRSDGQSRALVRAYERAGYGPETVGLVEAHGTGTKAGDAAEVDGLRAVFGDRPASGKACVALGTVKSQIGHTAAAAGAAGLLKVVMALHQKVLPPTIKVDQPDPALKLDESPFYLNTVARPWVHHAPHPRRGSVSSFGFGGTNYHVALEEYLGADGLSCASSLRTARNELLLLSAANATALIEHCQATAQQRGSLARLAQASQAAFDAGAPLRLAIVAESREDLAAKLREALVALRASETPRLATPGGVFLASGPALGGDLAFLFPGQGSQYVGMGADLAMAHARVRSLWDRLADQTFDGDAVHERVFATPVFNDTDRQAQEARLRATEWAQPALGLTSLAAFQLVSSFGLKPSFMLGHSFGELSALCAAGSFPVEDLLRLARARGELMRDAALTSPGGMLALVTSAEQAGRLVEGLGGAAVVANLNAADEVVISGTLAALQQVEAACAEASITARRLPVAAAFHSPAVAPASVALAKVLAGVELQAPRVTVLGNADADAYPPQPAAIRARLAEQLARPVRYAEQIETAYAAGVRCFVEMGPGAVLSELTRRILKGRPHLAVSIDRKSRDGVTSLHHALAQLATAGVPLDLAALWDGFDAPPLPAVKRAGSTVMLTGTNVGKPYPPNAKDRATAAALVPARAAALKSQTVAAASAPAAAKAEVPRHVAAPAPIPRPAIPAAAAPLLAALKAPAAVATAPAGPLDGAWVLAYQDIQRTTAETHAVFTRAMADGHAAFIAAMSASFTGLNAALAGGEAPPALAAVPALALPAFTAPPTRRAEPVFEPEHAIAAAPLAQASVPAAAAQAPLPDLSALLLAIVAEKTGYQAEMLQMHMDLEADLGIDSIKRVEILAAMRDAVPSLPDVKAADMAKIRTLGDVVSFLKGASGDDAALLPAEPPALATDAAEVPAVAIAPDAPAAGVDLHALLVAIVAEKTGYQAEMLAMHMDLEADLGIDSIKRVEILAAMRDAVPTLPDVKPADMARIRTLGDVVSFLAQVEAPAGDQASAAVETPETPHTPHTGDPTPAPEALQRTALRMVVEPASGLELPGLRGSGRVVVTDDGRGVAQALVRALAEGGVASEIVAEVPADAGVVVFLGGLRAVGTAAEAMAVNRAAFHAARAVAARHAAQPEGAPRRGAFIGVQDTGGDFGAAGQAPLRAWLGGVAGLVRTLAHEWPATTVKAIDCEIGPRSAEAVARALVHELFEGADVSNVGLSADGARRVQRAVASAAPHGVPVLAPGDVVVASGGARGVTAACLIALAQRCRPQVVLLGRTPLADEPPACAGAHEPADLARALVFAAQAEGRTPTPQQINTVVRSVTAGREVRATLAALQAAGARATYLAVDVQDAAAVRQALDGVRASMGPIRGLVHGAGVLADKRLVDKTDAQFDRVFDTKVVGLHALLEATADDPLAWLCLFSSFTAHAGNAGQTDYAMANEVLNQVACTEQTRRGSACVVRSIGWGPWQGGMVTPLLARHFQAMGVPLIPLDAGAAAFVAEAAPAGEVAVVIVGGMASTEPPPGRRATVDVQFEVRVDAAARPYLKDHAVQGVPVVPVALVAEWMLRAMQGLQAGRTPVLRSLKVLRGIRLEAGLAGLAGGSLRLVRHAQGDGWRLALHNPAGQLAYSANADFAADAPAVALQVEPASGQPGALSGTALYDGVVLFHGPAFQALRVLEVSPAGGMSADVVGLRALGWPAEPWQSDPAALDGMLQVGAKWAEKLLGGAVLPMAFGALHLLNPGALHGPLRATARTRQVRNARVVCDVVLADADGHPVAVLSAAEFVLRPDLVAPVLLAAAGD